MKKPFIPQYDDKQFINTTHKVNLTGGELSTILYIMEGYLQGSDDNEDDTFNEDYVSEWDDFSDVDVSKLLYIFRQLVLDKELN